MVLVLKNTPKPHVLEPYLWAISGIQAAAASILHGMGVALLCSIMCYLRLGLPTPRTVSRCRQRAALW